MLVIINGSFGIGKTTVANLLCQALPRSAIYDPEWAGYILKRLPKAIKLAGSGTDDYQDLVLWRKSAVGGARLFRRFVAGPLIIPMTFTCHAYFDEVVSVWRSFDPELRIFCLRASLATVQARLSQRGTQLDGPDGAWIARRIVECAEAHRDPHFGEPVDTEARAAHEVAQEILSRLQQHNQ